MNVQRDQEQRVRPTPGPNRLARAWALMLMLVMTLLMAPTALAQQQAQEQAQAQAQAPPAPPTLEIDVRTLLRGNQLFSDEVSGPVWRITARDGQLLVYLPLLVRPGEAEVELSQPPIDMRGGYFIAWHMPRPEAGRDRARGRDRGRQRDRRSDPVTARDPARDPAYEPAERWTPQPAPGEPTPADATTDALADFPEGAPEFARRLTVLPDGRLRWGVERSIRQPHGEVRSGTDPWLMKVRPDRIRELMPEPPSDRRDRAAVRAYQQQQREARAYQREVRELPDTFEVVLPRVWAVYAVMEIRSGLELQGEAPGLPWEIERDDLELLRDFARRRRGGQGPLVGDELAPVRRMTALVGSGQPLSVRSVAYALHGAEATARMDLNDPMHRLVRQIIAGPDAAAAQRVLRDLALAEPPTNATLSLLRDAADRMDSQTRLVALHGMLRARPTDLQQQRELFRVANQLLADASADAPAPERVLALMLEHIEPDGHLLRDATHGVDFAQLPADRQGHAIAFVIRNAGAHPLAENWLDHRLLGATEPALVRRTLELLNQADTGPTPMKPVVEAMFDLVFERRVAGRAGEPMDDARRPLDLHVPVLAPLRSDNHSLFRSLNSGDRAVHELAWGALPLFEIVDEAETAGVAERYELIIDSALGRGTVPGEVVTFLERQGDVELATRGLVRVALEADEATAVDAVRAMYGSQRPIGAALVELDTSQRFAFAQQAYRTLAGGAPEVAALMRDPSDRSNVARWFGEELAAGDLPGRADWVAPYRDQEPLLELAASDAHPDVARAAVRALVFAAGGDGEMADELARRLTADADRTVDDLREAWRSGRQEIHARRLAASAGDYRLVVQPPAEGDDYGPPPPIVLGVVELVTEHTAAYLGRNQSVSLTIPDDRFAIRIDQPNDLKNFPSREIADLPLRDIDEPLDLFPQPDGSWQGQAMMGRHGMLQVRLEPAG